MVLKKQTVWLLSMLTIMVVLSAYYLVQGPVQQVPVASKMMQEQPKGKDIQVESTQVTDKAAQNEKAAPGNSDDYFIGYKMQRDAWNQQKMDEYMAVMTNNDAPAQTVADAKDKYEKLVSMQDTEMTVENLIKALGYNEAVVISKDDRINVIVQADSMPRNKAVEIIALVTENLKVPGKNVVVSYKP